MTSLSLPEVGFSFSVFPAAFQPYDYGKAENKLHYGRESPPQYNVSNVLIPTRVYYGLNDHLTDYKVSGWLCSPSCSSLWALGRSPLLSARWAA